MIPFFINVLFPSMHILFIHFLHKGDKKGLIVIDGQTPSSQNVLKTLCNSDNFVSRRFMSTSGYLYIQFATGSVPMAFKAVYNFGMFVSINSITTTFVRFFPIST